MHVVYRTDRHASANTPKRREHNLFVRSGHQAGVEAPARTTLPNVGAADRGRHWAQRQRRLEHRT